MAKQICASQGYHIPVITTLHGTDITLVGKDKTYAPIVAFSINQSDAITSVSDNLKQETYQNFDIKKEIKVIHNFVDLNRFQRKDKEHFRKIIAPNDEKIIIHISNFRKVKRVQDVIGAFAQICPHIKAKLLLVGDGPERPVMEELARSGTQCGDIRFLGKQEPLEELLAISDLFLLPSEYESFGLAALEAMACQVPVISTNAGGLAEINEHGKTGYLCPVGDTEAMAKYALQILSNPQTLSQFRQNALAQAQRFDINTMLPQYVNLYQSLLS
jgi:N-acetyl-alpha-D-glucosaminyl L-malate synthase BshA